jgi:hypothetical protein
MTPDPRSVSLAAPFAGAVSARQLDANTVLLAASDPAAFRASGIALTADDGLLSLTLPPFAVVTLDGMMPTA